MAPYRNSAQNSLSSNVNDSIEPTDRDIWSSILKQVQQTATNKLPSNKSILVLGDNDSGKSSLIAKMQGIDTTCKGSGLEYHYLMVRDEYRDEQTQCGVWILDGNYNWKSQLLRFALNKDNFEDTTILVVCSMTKPWEMMNSLQYWMNCLQKHVQNLNLDSKKFKEYQDKNTRRFQDYISPGDEIEGLTSMRRSQNGDHSTTSTTGNNGIPIDHIEPERDPLPSDVLSHNLGLDIVVAITKTDYMSTLEKDYDFREEHFDFIQQYARKFCLQSLVVEKDAIFIPSGWDNEKKISILYDNIQSFSPDDNYNDVIMPPHNVNPTMKEPEIVSEDDQIFLMKLRTQLNQQVPSNITNTPLRGTPTGGSQSSSSNTATPVGGNTGTHSGGSANKSDRRQSHQTPSSHSASPAAAAAFLDASGKASPGGERVLQTFFNSLLSRKSVGGSGGNSSTPGGGNSSGSVRNSQSGVTTPNSASSTAVESLRTRDVQAELDRIIEVLLRRLNGTLEYHHLTGFMGPSGAGKTTLLNCLNGNVRDSGLTRDSEIYLNKFERQSPRIGFIEQHVNETIIGRLTVREILRHAFLFKNGWKFRSRAQIHIDSITDELMLDRSVLDRRFEHCSGGEQKRIAVAQELMSLVPPSLLFVDEPTTGLDSNAAFLVMRCLRKLANRYRMTVAVSIHTPNAEIVEMFDKLYILARGGVCIYSGTPAMLQENLQQQLNQLSDINFSEHNQSSHAMEEKNDNHHERPPIEQYLKIACTGLESDYVRLLADRTLEMENEKLLPHISRLDFLPWGTPRRLKPFTIGDLLLQLSLFRNEHRNRWYSLGTFFWSYLFVRFIEMNMFTLVTTILVYFPSGHHTIEPLSMTDAGMFQINWSRFGHFLGLFWLYNVYMQSIGQLVAVIFMDNAELSLIVSYVYYIILCLLNGYLINLEHMKDPFVLKVAQLLASNVISKGLLWSFYGLDRCNQEDFFSVILYKYYVNPETVYSSLTQVAWNTLILRMATLVFMFIRFDFSWQLRPMICSKRSKTKKIDYPPLGPSSIISIVKKTPPLPKRIKHNSELEFEQFSRDKIIVAWRNLTLFGSSSIHEIRSVRHSNSKIILRDLNGQFRFGTMNALMGTSGSGKTSLLKVLNVSGHLLPGLTAKQSLIYASRLKNYSMGIHEAMKTAETMVQNCSGGERKRLALALELTSMWMPNLICIDEPTSGLDSNSAEIVIGCLREFVHRHNVTIIASIHQPNTDLMNMFDQIYVLAKSGVGIYSGPPSMIRQHLSQITGYNTFGTTFPVEELIKYSCMNHDDPVVQKLVQNNDLNIITTTMANKSLETETQYVPDGIPLNRIRFSIGSLPILCSRYLTFIYGYLWQEWAMFFIIYIFYGFFLRYFFDPKIALADGCISLEEDFNQTCNRSTASIEEETNLTSNGRYNFFALNIFAFLVMLQCGLAFAKETKFFFNEHRNGWYSTGIFYLTKYLYETITMVAIVAVYLWIIDIYETVHPGIYWWMFLLLNLGMQAFQGLSHFLTLMADGNSFIFIAMANFSYIMMLLTANFFSRISSLHYIFQIVSFFSICRYMSEGNMILQYGFDRCGPKEIQAVLYNLEIPGNHYFHHCIQMLLLHIFIYRLMALAALIAKSNPLENRRRRAERIIKYHEEMKPSNAIIPGLSSHVEFHIKKIHY
ncbi:Cytoplasmic dynein 1 light intermediate chain 1, variant 2 [Dermatophagoides farinae]|uniref:Cytoplasmic dynein 1 light intermediate chain 1, variant 2 n=1 Tax=Dermatophagoides farinae TaxID=6954 RepID=A0A922IBF2_DERFA|nr:Cytoplasmic dynein 1 light intermediate chain 1, variant 2 [Dermatophagoides farinae]